MQGHHFWWRDRRGIEWKMEDPLTNRVELRCFSRCFLVWPVWPLRYFEAQSIIIIRYHEFFCSTSLSGLVWWELSWVPNCGELSNSLLLLCLNSFFIFSSVLWKMLFNMIQHASFWGVLTLFWPRESLGPWHVGRHEHSSGVMTLCTMQSFYDIPALFKTYKLLYFLWILENLDHFPYSCSRKHDIDSHHQEGPNIFASA